MNWLPEHDTYLQECFALSMSSSEAAAAISIRFKIDVSRNAAIGRAHRKGWKSKLSPADGNRSERRVHRAKPKPAARPKRAPQVFACEPVTGLRVADVVPLHLTLADLEPNSCRWPYGDSPFTFCGCAAFPGFPYCASHVALSVRSNFELRREAA